ncbi:MAG: SurA N-terminal domain-containing protein [Deltaproteobacteria bacterium]|nr:SurA N-terminal domain-containing protein [Deltaproteobacteria bacterium]
MTTTARPVLLLLSCLLPALPVSARIVDRIVAVVNHEVITLSELEEALRSQRLALATPQTTPGQVETRRLVLDRLIEERLIAQEAERRGFRATERDVDLAIEEVKRQNRLTQEDLLAALQNEGITMEAYRKSLHGQILRNRVLVREMGSPKIDERQITTYYEEHKSQFAEVDEARVAMIFLPLPEDGGVEAARAMRERARQIYGRAVQGENFHALARQHSRGPAAEDGGDVGFVRIQDLDPLIARVTVTLRDGQVSEPLEGPGGITILKLIEKRGLRARPLAEVRERVRQLLIQEDQARQYREFMRRLRETAAIDIKL